MKMTIATSSMALAALALSAPAALSNTAVLDSDAAGWRSNLTLYMMLPLSTQGTSTVDGNSANIDLDLNDVLDILNFGASARYEAWRENFGLILDGYYVDLGAGGALPGPGPAQVNVDVRQYWLAALGAYRVSSGTLARTGGRYSFDIQAGVRFNSLKQEIGFSGGPGGGGTFGGTETWWEPVIGARYVWEIDDRWTGGVAADFGGFGVNGSNLQWSATLGADYAFGPRGSLKLGLRYYSIDFSTNRPAGVFAYDVEQIGPLIGYTFKF